MPTTLNTPALDPVLMLDGRQPTLESRQTARFTITPRELPRRQPNCMQSPTFNGPMPFSVRPRSDARERRAAPGLPRGETASEQRGRRFFEDVPPDPTDGLKPGLCAHCHSGPLLNQTNQFAEAFIGLPIPAGARFSNVLVAEFNAAQNPVREFVFNPGAADEFHLFSPDPGRALITGSLENSTLGNVNAFKISALRGVRRTGPYFHDNSAKSLEDVAAHYATFFNFVTNGFIVLTPQDQKDLVAYMKLLD